MRPTPIHIWGSSALFGVGRDDMDEVIHIEGFFKEDHIAELFDGGGSGDDYWNMLEFCGLPKVGDQRVPIHTRHYEVSDDEVREFAVGVKEPHCLVALFRGPDFVTFLFEEFLEAHPDAVVVLNY